MYGGLHTYNVLEVPRARPTQPGAQRGWRRLALQDVRGPDAWLSILVVVETELKEIENKESREESVDFGPPLKLYFTLPPPPRF